MVRYLLSPVSRLVLIAALPVLFLSACVVDTATPMESPVFTGTRSPAPTGTPAPNTTGTPSPAITGTLTAPVWGVRTKTSGCAAQGALPDPGCTPGDIFPSANSTEVCKPGYASSVRNVTESEKNAVYAAYGIASHLPGQYEVDHFVSLELGGSNDISNLWPELAKPTPGFHQKDEVENYLHDQVCKGAMTLQEAQIKIATNWLDVYNSLPK